MSAPVQPVVLPPRVKIHLESGLKGINYWWIEVSLLPPVGSHIIPFDNDQEDLDFEWDHDEVSVTSHLWFIQRNLVAVFVDIDRPIDEQSAEDFCKGMLRAGWVRGDAEAWS
jgi:hypothetical protein